MLICAADILTVKFQKERKKKNSKISLNKVQTNSQPTNYDGSFAYYTHIRNFLLLFEYKTK